MSRPLALAGCVWLAALAAPAHADEIGPDDHHCALEVQQRDGSRCEECVVSIAQRQAGENPCAALAAREGWSERCSVGATRTRIVYCDREANFVEVGEGRSAGCGCRATGAREATPAWIAGVLLLVWARRAPRG